jgi:hypothetical protein
MSQQQQLVFDGLRFAIPSQGVSANIVDGTLQLDFTGFTGRLQVQPRSDEVSPTQSPPGGAPLGKRTRVEPFDDRVEANGEAEAEAEEHTDLLSQRHRPVSLLAEEAPHSFPNGGMDLSSDGEDAPPSSKRKPAARRSGSDDPSQAPSQPSAEAAVPCSPGGVARAASAGASSDDPAADAGGGSSAMRSAARSPHPFDAQQPVTQWEWRRLGATGEAPSARWAHTAVALGDTVFVFGGDGSASEDGSGAMNDLYRLDVGGGTPEWKRCMDAPQRRAWHSAVAASELLLVFGGESLNEKGKKTHLGSMWSYDPEFEVWYEATDRGHRPSARAGHTACVHEANGKGLKMLVFGGVARGDRHIESTLHELHVGADWSWRKVLASGPQPDARAYHTCTMLGTERMLVFGGNDAAHSFEQLHLLELASMTWSLPAVHGTPPTPRTGHAALCLDGRRLLIHGGWDPRPGSDEPEIWDDLVVLDTQTWSWSRPPVHGTPPSPRTGHSLVACGGALYLFGGLGEEDVLGDAFVLAPRL